MATGGIENMSDEIVNIKCCICDKKNIKTEAEKYCVVCQDYYCTSCADMHTMFLPSGIEHKLLDKGDFATTGQTTSLPSIPVQRCDIHPTKLLDMYCKDHDKIICSSCVALKHRTCQDIHSVPDEIDSLYQPAAYEEVKHELRAVRKTMADLKKVKEHLLTKLDQSKKKALEDIKSFRKEMEAFLDHLEAESIVDVEERYEKMKTNLDENIDKVKDYSAKLEQSIIQLRESVGNKGQEFICIKLAEENIKQVMEDKLLTVTESVKIIFQEDSKCRGIQNDVKKLGKIEISRKQIHQQRVTAYQVKSEKEICVNHSTDKENVRILGSCLLSGWLLLSDINNCKLKRVDISTGLMKDVLKTEAGCCGICVTNEEEAEMVVCTRRKIQFVNVGDNMVATKQLKFDHECYGIACKNNQIFISDMEKSFYIYDMTGKILHSVKNDHLGKPLFGIIRHVTVSGDMVYIADHDKGLVALDINGNYKFTLTDPALRLTQWVCPDRRGNLFVGGFDSTEIVQMNEASHKVIGVFGKIKKTLSASFDPELSRLIVTEHENDKVKIYDLA